MNKTQFLIMATLFEGGLVVVAYLLGWWMEIDPMASFAWRSEALSLGLLGTFPLLAFFGISYRLPVSGLEKIKRLLIDTLGSLLAASRWYELAYVAALAGVGEEVLFRGVLQPWLESLWGWGPALLISNLLFGLAHSVTPLYTVLAAMTGMYLGWLLDVGGERNLLVPIVVHSVYDLAAFVIVVAAYRAERAA
ncbi:MAG: CPBP family intramembrane glutamic endopeptidase [Methylohalobius sp. ZOD2]